MNFKYLIILIIFFCSSFIANAQDIIVQTSGDEIKSKVIEITLESIKYKTYDNQSGPLRNISKSEVFMIIYENGTRETIENSNHKASKTRKNKSNNTKEHENGTSVQLGAYFGDYSDAIGINIIQSFMLGRNVSLGIGLGLLADPEYIDEVGAPIFLDSKFYFRKKINSPFIYGNLGGVISLSGGENYVMYESGAGFNFKTGSKNSMAISLGYQLAEYSYEDYYGYETTDTSGALTLKIAYMF